MSGTAKKSAVESVRGACGGAEDFTDPSEYQSKFRQVRVGLAICRGGNFKASLAWLDLPNLLLFEASESLPRIAFVTLPSERAFITFPIHYDSAPVWNGVRLRPDQIVFHNVGNRFHQRSTGPTKWACISVRPEFLAHQSLSVFGEAISLPKRAIVIQSSATIVRRLQKLHSKACRLARTIPAHIAHPQISRSLENEIMYALLTALSADKISRFGAGPRSHSLLVSRVSQILMTENGLSVVELAAMVGASDRTLRSAFSNILGLSPIRYKCIWQLNKVRRILQLAGTSQTIADIARQHGFAEPGRFAVDYRKLFGESPSATRKKSENA